MERQTETWWEPPMRGLVENRDVVLAGAVAAVWTAVADQVTKWGARSVMVVATEGRGIGPAPEVPTFVMELPSDMSMMDRLHAGLDALADPPTEMIEALNRFDPRREALVLSTFLNTSASLAGRPALAFRRPEWVALEDKTLADGIWDRAGVARRPSVVVPVEQARGVAPAFDDGAGTVWAADSREGFHGGASMVRWVVDDDTAARALAHLAPHCDNVRVMPFVEGVPCSIHGFVFANGTAVLRPVEMVTLRQGHDLVYSGCATFWDPPLHRRDEMRAACRRVADVLRREVEYRGAFTIDGVMRDDGFWPTELNPRFGAGLHPVARGAPDLPLPLLNDLIVAGLDVGLDADGFERALVELADGHRAGGTWSIGAQPNRAVDGDGVVADGDGLRWAHDGEEADATVVGGPGMVRALLDPARTPAGPSVAPWACEFWAFADRELGTGIGPLTPAAGSRTTGAR